MVAPLIVMILETVSVSFFVLVVECCFLENSCPDSFI